MNWLLPVPADIQRALVSVRPNETKIGQQIHFLNDHKSVADYTQCRFVLLGIPEDIGPRANCGLGGAHEGWLAFLKRFSNAQANQFLAVDDVLIAGTVKCDDLQRQADDLDNSNPDDLAKIRTLCEELDLRVKSTLDELYAQGLCPIIIGGGHNNALPAIQALAQHQQSKVACINLDPHSDFRPPEGRHSGNGFSYAYHQGILSQYFVVGLHEQKNSGANIALLNDADFKFASYQDIWTRRELTLGQALTLAADYVSEDGLPVGIELDVDSIAFMPSSAYTNCGITFQDAEHYTYWLAKHSKADYLHLAEGAPARHPAGIEAGASDVGQVLTGLVCSFLQGKKEEG